MGGERSGHEGGLHSVRSGHEGGLRPVCHRSSGNPPAVPDSAGTVPRVRSPLAASTGWGERELHGAYFNDLSDRHLYELNTCDLPTSLDGLVKLTLCVDARLADRHASRRLRDPDQSRERSCARSRAPPHATEAPDPDPMQVGRTKLSGSERQRRRDRLLCLYCGEAGHVLSTCPVKDHARQ